MFSGCLDILDTENYLEIVNNKYNGEITKINDFEMLHASLNAEYFNILASYGYILYDFRNKLLSGFKEQVLARYSDILQDIDSITFIQKFYNINIGLCRQYPSKFVKLDLKSDFIIEKTNKIIIYNKILDEKIDSDSFVSFKINKYLKRIVDSNKNIDDFVSFDN